MAHNGLTKTGVYHNGTKYVCQAHYPSIEDYVEESFDIYDDAKAFRDTHNAAGANVQIHEHKWIETFIASGWYPARVKG